MKIAFAGTGYINKVHAQAAQNLGLELAAVVNNKADSMIEFGKRFGISRQYETVEAMLKDGGVWFVPRSATIVHVYPSKKEVRILRGLKLDSSIERVIKEMGWTVKIL